MSNPNQPRLVSFALDGWDVLGGRVSVSLSDGVEVLVSRNGAGKSAILEGFEAISSRAAGESYRPQPGERDSIPKILDIQVSTPTGRHLEYRYEMVTLSASTNNSGLSNSISEHSEKIRFSWNERCQYVDGQKELLWVTESGATTFNNEGAPIIAVLGTISSVRQSQLPELLPFKLPDEMQWVYAVLNGVRLLGKYPVRRGSRRYPCFLSASGKGISFTNPIGELSNLLAQQILSHSETEELRELEKVCQRVGLGNQIIVRKFFHSGDPGETTEGETEGYVASVLLDGVNLGLLSDGTLRILSILVELVFSSSNSSTTTIIEEPETQIHPGMLAKLLNEVEAYTFGENLILSTHSPQVVAWTKPNQINLVARNNGRTIVRKLGEDEIHNVVEYLCEEGNLGEWIYSGILDE